MFWKMPAPNEINATFYPLPWMREPSVPGFSRHPYFNDGFLGTSDPAMIAQFVKAYVKPN